MQQDGAATAPTPFSAMFGANMFDGMNGTEIDWGAWDSFIQGSSMPGNVWPSMLPDMTMPVSAIDPAIENAGFGKQDTNANSFPGTTTGTAQTSPPQHMLG